MSKLFFAVVSSRVPSYSTLEWDAKILNATRPGLLYLRRVVIEKVINKKLMRMNLSSQSNILPDKSINVGFGTIKFLQILPELKVSCWHSSNLQPNEQNVKFTIPWYLLHNLTSHQSFHGTLSREIGVSSNLVSYGKGKQARFLETVSLCKAFRGIF